MSHVFISYSRQDKEFVERLVKDLSDNRITYWFDQEGIRPAIPIGMMSYMKLFVIVTLFCGLYHLHHLHQNM